MVMYVKDLGWEDQMATEEVELRLFVCSECWETVEDRVLVERNEDGDYEQIFPICSCGAEMEEFGTEEVAARVEALRENWTDKAHSRVETSVTRKGLFPKYNDELGRDEVLSRDYSPIERLARRARWAKRDGRHQTIVYPLSAMVLGIWNQNPFEIFPSQGHVLDTIKEAIIHGEDVVNWGVHTINYWKENTILWSKEHMYFIVPTQILSKENLAALTSHLCIQKGRQKILQALGMVSWRLLEILMKDDSTRAVTEASIGHDLLDFHYQKEMGVEMVKVTPNLGLQVQIWPDGDQFTTEEDFAAYQTIGREARTTTMDVHWTPNKWPQGPGTENESK